MDSTTPISEEILDETILKASSILKSHQTDDGHWAFELEADVCISAEYIMLNHYLDEIDDDVESKIANYLRAKQGDHGGWPLFLDGNMDLSSSVKAYYALKLAGDNENAPHMVHARKAILDAGGAVNVNVFTRFSLALFGQIPWKATPVARIEILSAPEWFPLHITKVSYWTRTVTVPLLILTALRPKARNSRRINIDELFHKSPWEEKYKLENPTSHWLGSLMVTLDRIARPFESLIPSSLTKKSIDRALKFIFERLNGEDGLGGIYPAMANSLMAFDALGISRDDSRVQLTRKAIDNLLVIDNDSAYCQPCLSPVWDTGLAAHAILETSDSVPENGYGESIRKSCEWLKDLQIKDIYGDWISKRPGVRPGGWAFQYRNDYYPDVDDTAVVGMALHRSGLSGHEDSINRAAEWIIGMQSTSGGWAAFDADNEHYILDHMPFADHGALLDPPSVDVTARCVSFLAQIGYDQHYPVITKGIEYIKREQESDGSWFGRWGTNYIYGTWSVLSALNAAGEDMDAPYIKKAVHWLKSCQLSDGGWGEDCATYWDESRGRVKAPLPSQTAWALLGLMAAGEVDDPSALRGVKYLVENFEDDDAWEENYFNAVGFPRVFYLRYHGYRLYFPLLALARYRNLIDSNDKRPKFGM